MSKAWPVLSVLLACALGVTVTYSLRSSSQPSGPPPAPETFEECLRWGLTNDNAREVKELCEIYFAAVERRDRVEAEVGLATAGAELGEALQAGTNLFWLRCPVGTTWDGEGCEGEARELGFGEVLNACPSPYRVPTRDELIGLLEPCADKGTRVQCVPCAQSLFCAALFGWDTARYWVRSEPGDHAGAWVVELETGHIGPPGPTEHYQLRCVRRGL